MRDNIKGNRRQEKKTKNSNNNNSNENQRTICETIDLA